MNGTTLPLLIHGIMGLAIIAAVTTLLALGDLSESTAIAMFTAAISLVGGSATAAMALKVPPAATTRKPPTA